MLILSAALKVDHARVIDTSFVFKYGDETTKRRPSLNDLCKACSFLVYLSMHCTICKLCGLLELASGNLFSFLATEHAIIGQFLFSFILCGTEGELLTKL